MHIEQVSHSKLNEYARVSIAYEIKTVLEICPIDNGLGGLQQVEKTCTPYVKDYDLLPDCHPLNWKDQFELDTWGIFIAVENGMLVGGAAAAPEMEGFKKDSAVLWDLRVHPDARKKGIGRKLLEAIIHWSKERGCKTLSVETQNVNTPACRFYSANGFVLGTIDQQGYSQTNVENETKLIWSKHLEG
ncbi:GNAT family N-acetyltransferase [Bacillus salacetis]|uniref:GNAT family N-acetyltransferase n=1 Tax=Bacillus salacetis TaxID=2315464 RepID=A0A3A1QRN7_9BACI|nr:GNAT family N-acetyltransferase [Bacillus salacetis]RIW28931.1 GNAT family N-acetyltransferase [Bacillus salacetis]